MREIRDHALLQKTMIGAVELFIRGGVLLRLFLQKFEKAARQDFIELLHERSVLHRFTGDIEWQILAVHHALEETEPFREETFSFGLDEHFAAIEVHLRL